jgi:hypothetical protein
MVTTRRDMAPVAGQGIADSGTLGDFARSKPKTTILVGCELPGESWP